MSEQSEIEKMAAAFFDRNGGRFCKLGKMQQAAIEFARVVLRAAEDKYDECRPHAYDYGHDHMMGMLNMLEHLRSLFDKPAAQEGE